MKTVRLLAAGACVAALLWAPAPASADGGAPVDSLTCVSGTAPLVLSPYSPRISSPGGAFFSTGDLWCQIVEAPRPVSGKPADTSSGPGTLQMSGTFTGTAASGLAVGQATVYYAGREAFIFQIAAVFADGVGPFAGPAIDDDGGSGAATGTFVEPSCPPIGQPCSITGAYAAFTIALADPRPIP
ncbi:MAG TPA: hypothetical protein VGO92_04160 [Acidimicrobiales bacterium]|jgi:hypothetical protein|nr:hypothetical protein [Acidimicrobiales bacterium]